MAVVPHTVDIVVADMARALAFYRILGLPIEAGAEAAPQVEVRTPGGYALGFMTEELVRRAAGSFEPPAGQRVSLALRCDDPDEVDATYARAEAAGHPGARAPWDAFWGQRYASLRDPDGNRVDLFAAPAGA